MSARKYLDDTGLASLWAKIVNKINAAGDAFVKKRGDTLTGALILANTTFNPESTSGIESTVYRVTDRNSNKISEWIVKKPIGTKTVSSIFSTKRYRNNDYDVNELTLSVDENGDKSVEVSSPSAWRSALGLASVASSGNYNDLSNKPTIPVGSDYVLKAGDTMTGDLTMSASSIREDFRNSSGTGELSIYYGENKKDYGTSSGIKNYDICTRDVNNLIGSYIEFSTANQQSYVSIGARDYWSTGAIGHNAYFAVAVTGPYDTPAYLISHPKQLLDASTSIGKLTSGTGSKTSSWTASGTVYCNWVRSGHVVSVEYSFTISLGSGSSLARWTNLFTGLPKPYQQSIWVLQEGGTPLILNTNGVFQNVYVISNSVFFRGSFTYLTDDFN